MIKRCKILKVTALALCVSQLVACGTTGTMAKVEGRIEQTRAMADQLRLDAIAGATKASVSRTTSPRLAGAEISLGNASALPEVFSSNVVLNTQGMQSLAEILESISSMTKVRIRGSEVISVGASSAVVAAPVGQRGQDISGKTSIEHNGSFRGLLDELAARNSASWRWNAKAQAVEFFKYETRTLSVYLPPGTKSIASSISLAGVSSGGGGSAGGGGGASTAGNVSVNQSLTVNPWASLMSGIQGILEDGASSRPGTAGGVNVAVSGGSGVGVAAGASQASGTLGKAVANQELGLITVTARPEAVERVASYINSINSRFAQNLYIDIKVLNLSLGDQAALGFSLDAVYNSIGKFGASIVGAPPLQPATGSPGQFILASSGSSRWSGSQVVIQALQQFGNVSLQTQGQVLAVNGQPSPIQVANEINYLASSATTQTANVGSTSTLTPGTKVVGFTANFLPLMLGDNRILLQYALNLSSLTALTQITSGTSSIQTPQISSQSLQQQAFVKDGEAIVLFGFDQNRDSLDAATSFSGLSRSGSSNRQMVVIVIQVNAGAKNV